MVQRLPPPPPLFVKMRGELVVGIDTLNVLGATPIGGKKTRLFVA